ncbi:MAG: alpha/beta fold hydrolase [Pseudomonadota bacterium]
MERTAATIKVGDLDIGYTQMGAGPDLVLVHGGFADRRMWGDLPERLAGAYRVTTYDLRGHGETGPSGYAVYSGDVFAKDLVGLLDALGIARAHLLGLSLGGIVAQHVAAGHGDRVERLVLGSTMVRHDLTAMDRAATYFPFISPSLTLRALGPIPFARASLAIIRAARGKGWMSVNPETREFLIQLASEMSRAEYVKVLRAVYRNEGVDLSRIAAPTLVLTGEAETETLDTHADHLAREIAGAERAVVAGAGHIMNLDAPDLFASIVTRFLRGDALSP